MNTENQKTPEEIEELKKQHIRSFAMRRGHISNAQERGLEVVFPKFEIKYDPDQKINPSEIFGNQNPVVLEIGCGMGETTAAIAENAKNVNFIGCEVYPAGVGSLANRLDQADLTNVRIIKHDAVDVIKNMLPDSSLDGIHIFFPDPWRKARHHKRRLISSAFLELIVPKMKKGAYFHCATDWENYAEQMQEVLSSNESLENYYSGKEAQPKNPLVDRPTTKFNERGNRLGHGCWDFVYIKK